MYLVMEGVSTMQLGNSMLQVTASVINITAVKKNTFDFTSVPTTAFTEV